LDTLRALHQFADYRLKVDKSVFGSCLPAWASFISWSGCVLVAALRRFIPLDTAATRFAVVAAKFGLAALVAGQRFPRAFGHLLESTGALGIDAKLADEA
jgi:hypothetical protein